MPSRDDAQKLFIQAVISRRYLSKELTEILVARCIAAVRAADDTLNINSNYDAFIISVNNALNPLDLELAFLHDEITGRQMCALVNRKGDELAQIATDYSPVEIAYFKALVERIMLAPNESYSVSSLAALRETAALGSSMTKTQAEIVLASFVAKGWLNKSLRGRYSLSTRTLLELQPYIKSTYADEVIECTVCFEIVTRGIGCFTANCKARLHDHCFTNYRKNKHKCPTCNADWSTNEKKLLFVGEKAAGADDAKRKERRRKSVAGSDEEEGEGEPSQSYAADDSQEMEVEANATQDDPEPTQSQPNGRNGRSRAKAPSASQVDESMEVDEEDSPPPAPARRSRRKN